MVIFSFSSEARTGLAVLARLDPARALGEYDQVKRGFEHTDHRCEAKGLLLRHAALEAHVKTKVGGGGDGALLLGFSLFAGSA